MAMFQAVTEESLAATIRSARRRVVYVAPAVSKKTVDALVELLSRGGVEPTMVLAGDEDAYRVGLGDPEGLKVLGGDLLSRGLRIRRQPGLRMGLLVADDPVVIWSPTPRAVEAERANGEPNGIVLHGEVADSLSRASGGDRNGLGSESAEIGVDEMSEDDIQEVGRRLEENPPGPVDLSRKARVFSTRFQFVEVEVRGAEWTSRSVWLSTLLVEYASDTGMSTSELLNADLPKAARGLLESRLRPYEVGKNIAVDVPVLACGEIAHRQDRTPIRAPMTEDEVQRAWGETKKRFLVQIKGFGTIIRKQDVAKFRAEAKAHETIMGEWVQGFHDAMQAKSGELIENLVEGVERRISAASDQRMPLLEPDQLRHVFRRAFEKNAERTPSIRLVTKDIAWESTRDAEFTSKLRRALPAEDLDGWFEEFDTVRKIDQQRGPES